MSINMVMGRGRSTRIMRDMRSRGSKAREPSILAWAQLRAGRGCGCGRRSTAAATTTTLFRMRAHGKTPARICTSRIRLMSTRRGRAGLPLGVFGIAQAEVQTETHSLGLVRGERRRARQPRRLRTWGLQLRRIPTPGTQAIKYPHQSHCISTQADPAPGVRMGRVPVLLETVMPPRSQGARAQVWMQAQGANVEVIKGAPVSALPAVLGRISRRGLVCSM
mmetsp:Transcript_25713/g.56877  ORF Transcript_25713/g.56877 Transcript_25713/m.56877 type:complete len:221 (+) Transcript_25713:655-1317(+)